MSDPGIRRRKKGQDPSSSTKSPQKSTVKPSSSQSILIIISLLLFALGVLTWQNPELIRRVLEPWFRPQWRANPGASDGMIKDFSADIFRRDAVVEAFKHAWRAYERDAMGDDEYHPISFNGTNLTDAGGIGYTVVDSIDTMLMMGLDEDYQRARDWIANSLSFEKDGNFNTFETTIRVLGGLLSAYHLSEDPMFLDKAKDLADRILPAFDTPSGLPLTMINLAKREGVADPGNKGFVSTAEAATLQLEFRYLAWLTDEEIYWEKAEKVMELIKQARLATGLAAIFMNPQDGHYALSAIRLGSRGDSYYEYLLKQYLQTNMTEEVYRGMYDDAMDSVYNHLVRKSPTSRLTYTSELVPERHQGGELSWRLVPKQDHLVCFLGGSLMLGAITTGAANAPFSVSTPPREHELTDVGKRDWTIGRELIETCMKTHDTATGLAPEIVHFRIPTDNLDESMAPGDWYIKGARRGEPAVYDARYILRPETVESLFIAFRLTGDYRYRDYGWSIFQAIEKHCRVETGGYASIINVDEIPSQPEDKMETFFMSETLKYLYLLFEDANAFPLDKYVFNTEAHPFPIFHPSIRTGFS